MTGWNVRRKRTTALREAELDTAYRRLVREVERREAQTRWTTRWEPLLWIITGGIVGAMVRDAASRMVGQILRMLDGLWS